MSSVDTEETPESCALQHKPIENIVLKAALRAWACAAFNIGFQNCQRTLNKRLFYIKKKKNWQEAYI